MKPGASTPARSPVGARLQRRPQLSEQVATELRNAIMTAAIRPGEFIRLDETAERLGVSVTPVREALLTLRGEGMVELAPHRGYVVTPLRRVDVADLFWLQAQIAVKLALRTAEVVTADQLEQLTDCNERLRKAIETGNADGVVDAEFDFHRTHNLIADSGKLAWFLLSAARYTPALMYAADPEWGRVALDSHARLIEAYRTGDHDEVVVQTQRQFDDGAARLVRHLETTGIWDDPPGHAAPTGPF